MKTLFALVFTMLAVLSVTGIMVTHSIPQAVADTPVPTSANDDPANDDPANDDPANNDPANNDPANNDPVDSRKPTSVTVEAARVIAATLHDAMHSALQVTHDRYYREDEGLMIPAAALQEVFADIKSERNITLRWLVVEGQAMNIDHEAQDDFEKSAVKALISGKTFHDDTTPTTYRRAAPITLSNHCLKCHVPDRRSTRDRKAGLIVSIPITR